MVDKKQKSKKMHKKAIEMNKKVEKIYKIWYLDKEGIYNIWQAKNDNKKFKGGIPYETGFWNE